jgi:hypothetical protein
VLEDEVVVTFVVLVSVQDGVPWQPCARHEIRKKGPLKTCGCVRVCVHVCVLVCVCVVCVCMCWVLDVYKYLDTRTHAHTHTHIIHNTCIPRPSRKTPWWRRPLRPP